MPNFITPAEVIAVLNEAKVRFMLVGLHGVAEWMQEPRGTEDVDVLVATRGHKKAVRALLRAFPHLEEYDLPVVTRLRDKESKRVAVDVIKPVQEPYCDALNHAVIITAGDQKYRIPTLEMALVMKFAPMVSLFRADEDKYQDAHDFIRIVKNNPEIDLKTLSELGERIYPGGGKEVVEMVRRVRASEKLIL
jgi:hypothetical protein